MSFVGRDPYRIYTNSLASFWSSTEKYVITTGSNTISLGVQRRLSDVSRGLNTSFERLSSGLRINRSSDDAAGLAIADSLNADARV